MPQLQPQPQPPPHDFTPSELERLRHETPLVAAGKLHLNHAGASPSPEPVLAAVRDYFEAESLGGGYETAAARRVELDGVYEAVARLIGADASEIALVENATAAFALALSSIDFAAGQQIVTSRNDYVSHHLMFLALARRRGVKTTVVPDAADGGIDVEALANTLEQLSLSGGAGSAALVTLSWMPTNSGLLQPAAEVGEVCRSFDVPYLVDACQTVGQLPVAVGQLQCDFLAATGRKFLRGPRGTGFLYVASRQLAAGRYPLTIDLGGADWVSVHDFALREDARRFETWEQPYALLPGLGTAARYAQDVGLGRIAARSAALAARLRSNLVEVASCRVLDRGSDLGAIVSVAIGKGEPGSAERAMQQLRELEVHTSVTARSSALLEFERLGVHEALRLSPHYLNTAAEVDRATELLERVTSS